MNPKQSEISIAFYCFELPKQKIDVLELCQSTKNLKRKVKSNNQIIK